jgi:hypothetical protein
MEAGTTGFVWLRFLLKLSRPSQNEQASRARMLCSRVRTEPSRIQFFHISIRVPVHAASHVNGHRAVGPSRLKIAIGVAPAVLPMEPASVVKHFGHDPDLDWGRVCSS